MMPLDKHRGIITLHPQLDILPAQPLQLRALALAHRGVAVCLAAAFPGTPVTQRALVDAQLPGHLRDRLARLEHQPHRALLKILIELPVLPCHRSSSKRCLHITRGSPPGRNGPGSSRAPTPPTPSDSSASHPDRRRYPPPPGSTRPTTPTNLLSNFCPTVPHSG